MVIHYWHLWLLLFPLSSYGQNEYFEYNNPNAIELTRDRIELLTSKKWFFNEVEDIRRTDTLKTKLSGEIKYQPIGDYQYDWLSGKWFILKGKFIKHEAYSYEESKKKNFGGLFVIIKLNDQELIMNKLQTSNHDMMKTYYLTSEPILEPMSYHQARSIRKKLDSATIQKLSKISIEEAFMRGMYIEGDTLLVPTQDSVYRIKLEQKTRDRD